MTHNFDLSIRIIEDKTVPKKDAFSIDGGRTIVMHPAIATEMRRQVRAKWDETVAAQNERMYDFQRPWEHDVNAVTPTIHPQQAPEIILKSRHLGQVINKPVDLRLQYSGLLKAYQVVSITSTVCYKPGQWLHEVVVDECCTEKGWSVAMVHDDFLKSLLGSIISLPKLVV